MLNKRIILLIGFSLFYGATYTNAQEFAHEHLTNALKRWVEQGRVNYNGICQDPDFQSALKDIEMTDVKTFSDSLSGTAFWINAYNAFNVKIICERYPIKNINQLHKGGLMFSALTKNTIWDRPVVVIRGERFTLKQIDHEVLRQRFSDPRIQFGLACLAVSCPLLRAEAYEGTMIDRQLQEQTQLFLNDPFLNSFDLANQRAELSSLLNWNAKYFGKTKTAILKFIANYLSDELAQSLTSNPDQWKIVYKPYDLTINDVRGAQ